MQIPTYNVQHIIKIKNGIMINVNLSVKSIACAKTIIVGILSTCTCENSRYLKKVLLIIQ